LLQRKQVKSLNILDKAIAAFAPVTGLKRAAARKVLNSGYGNYGASHTKKSMLG